MDRRVLLFDFVFVFAVGAFTGAFWAAGGHHDTAPYDGEIVENPARSPADDGETLRLMTWNIAFARGTGSPKEPGWHPPSRRTIRRNLAHVAEVLERHRVDVALLQEVDFDAERSHGIDEFRELLRMADFPYGARALAWRANYIPYPYWPPSHHYGEIHSGGAVLSRYPIRANKVAVHPKPEETPWWVRMFLIPRYSQAVELEVDGANFWVVNNHLGAAQWKNERAQIERLTRLVSSVARDSDAPLLALGGDMNAVPPPIGTNVGSRRPNIQFLPELLEANPGLHPAIAFEDYHENPARHATVNVGAPRTKLDYVFVASDRATVRSVETLHVHGPSDHRPVLVELALDRHAESSRARRRTR